MTELAKQLFERLFSESREALRRYIRRRVQSDDAADEIVQEAFLRTFELGGTVKTPRAFLFSTARNLATDRYRHDRRAAADSGDSLDVAEVAGPGVSPEDGLIADEASRLLKQAIERLPPQCHAALTLKVFHGYSYTEIAAILRLSEKTVEKHIARGLERTHEYMRARYSGYRRVRDRSGGQRG